MFVILGNESSSEGSGVEAAVKQAEKIYAWSSMNTGEVCYNRIIDKRS